MRVDEKHPLYTERLDDWELMRDAYRGEEAVKEAGEKYLPATTGHKDEGLSSGQPGQVAYQSYQKRARYPEELVQDAVLAAIGLMHRKPPTISVPKKLEPMLERCTKRGETPEQLLRRMNEEQLVPGRLGLLLDFPEVASGVAMPFIATYSAESVINWDEGATGSDGRSALKLVVLNESGKVRSGLQWQDKTRHRVLLLGDLESDEPGPYTTGVFEGGTSFSMEAMRPPVYQAKPLEHIPFVFCNAQDLSAAPCDPPLRWLARLALVIYRAEADYRQSLFMQGQDTAVLMGVDVEDGKEGSVRTGAGGLVCVPVGGDFKFEGVDSAGLPEQRMALENDYQRAQAAAGKSLENGSKSAESGDALRIRQAGKTASLSSIALTSAGALESMFKSAAIWMGADPNEVEVKPNLEFAEVKLDGPGWKAIMEAKRGGKSGGGGLVLSDESVHAVLQEQGIAKFKFEEEMEKLEEEREAEAKAAREKAANGPPPETQPTPPEGAA